MPDNKIQNIPLQSNPPDVWQQPVAPVQETNYYDDYQDYRGMNRFMLMIILAAMIPWFFGGYQIFGFNITGWAWVLPLVLSALICLKNITHITFPISLWFTWMGLLLLYWLLDMNNPNATQSYFQTLSPVIIGCAASTFRADNWQLENVVRWLTRLAWFAWIILLIRMPMIITGILPGYGFMAAEMIGLLLLGACYASFYACGSNRHLYYYLSILAISFIALVRGPMTAMLSCMPLTLAPLGIKKRIVIATVLLICSIIIFNSERIQNRMFYSGGGEISDLRMDNPDFSTGGRSLMWEILWHGVKENPWFGNGWNSHRNILIGSGLPIYLPHNDWLKLLYDIGVLGITIFLLTIILQIFFLVRFARCSSGAHRMLAYGAATAFFPYMLIMFTDNVVLYVQFFGNLHFALIGIIYGAMQRDIILEDESIYR